jgi:hypothetical protein
MKVNQFLALMAKLWEFSPALSSDREPIDYDMLVPSSLRRRNQRQKFGRMVSLELSKANELSIDTINE